MRNKSAKQIKKFIRVKYPFMFDKKGNELIEFKKKIKSIYKEIKKNYKKNKLEAI